MTEEQAARLINLRPHLVNIVGFYDLIDSFHDATPLQALTHRVHFTASSLKVALELIAITDEILDERGV